MAESEVNVSTECCLKTLRTAFIVTYSSIEKTWLLHSERTLLIFCSEICKVTVHDSRQKCRSKLRKLVLARRFFAETGRFFRLLKQNAKPFCRLFRQSVYPSPKKNLPESFALQGRLILVQSIQKCTIKFSIDSKGVRRVLLLLLLLMLLPV